MTVAPRLIVAIFACLAFIVVTDSTATTIALLAILPTFRGVPAPATSQASNERR